MDVGSEPRDESITTTLKVIMDVLKSHEGSIKDLKRLLETKENKATSKKAEDSHRPHTNEAGNVDEKPLYDNTMFKEIEEIPDDKSEVSSIISNRTEYQDLPTRSTLLGLTLESTTTNLSSMGLHTLTQTESSTSAGLTSTPMKRSPPVGFSASHSSLNGVETLKGNSSFSKPAIISDLDVTMKQSAGAYGSYSGLVSKMQFLENQVNEWGDVVDEMSDRMANQPSLIRKFAKESAIDKVNYKQHNEDLEELEKRLLNKIDEKFSSIDRKIVELYDDVMSQVGSLSLKSSPSDRMFAKQETAVQLGVDLDALSQQFAEHDKTIQDLSKGVKELESSVSRIRQDTTLARRRTEKARSDSELVSLVAEQLSGREDITGWRLALKEIHAALNRQSEINSSLHNSCSSLDRRFNGLTVDTQLNGRWRWSGMSGIYPKTHSCVNDPQEEITFVSQIKNSDPRTLIHEKGKPHIVVASPGCYWVTVCGFLRKSGAPPSLQLTVDEDPVPLFNSSGKSPSHQRISVVSSVPKYQPSGKYKMEGTPTWRPGSSLVGAIIIQGHSRISVCPTTTASGLRTSVEGFLDLQKLS